MQTLRRRGAPPGNANALKHGRRSRRISSHVAHAKALYDLCLQSSSADATAYLVAMRYSQADRATLELAVLKRGVMVRQHIAVAAAFLRGDEPPAPPDLTMTRMEWFVYKRFIAERRALAGHGPEGNVLDTPALVDQARESLAEWRLASTILGPRARDSFGLTDDNPDIALILSRSDETNQLNQQNHQNQQNVRINQFPRPIPDLAPEQKRVEIALAAGARRDERHGLHTRDEKAEARSQKVLAALIKSFTTPPARDSDPPVAPSNPSSGEDPPRLFAKRGQESAPDGASGGEDAEPLETPPLHGLERGPGEEVRLNTFAKDLPMTPTTRFLVDHGDITKTRTEQEDPPDPAALADGEVLLKVDRFALTANNVTYAAMGKAMRYREFFPGPEGWSHLPVWGFAEVIASRCKGVTPGQRYYGYYPTASTVVLQARPSTAGFEDASERRSTLSSAYNQYLDVARDSAYDPAAEAAQMILRPLFLTSFLLADYLATNDYFGAETVFVSSASSKTARGTAFLLKQRQGRPRLVGLTSPSNLDFAKGIGYDDVFAYDSAHGLPNNIKAAYVDFSGNAKLRRTIHERFRENLVASVGVGMTDWDDVSPNEELPGPAPSFFFAPTHLRKAGGWGEGGFLARFTGVWPAMRDALGGRLEIKEEHGAEAVEGVYRALLEGRDDPRLGHVLTL